MGVNTSEGEVYKSLCLQPPTEEYMEAFSSRDNPLNKPWSTIVEARSLFNETFEEPIVKWFESRLPQGKLYGATLKIHRPDFHIYRRSLRSQ